MKTAREEYFKEYRKLGSQMFTKCKIPTVWDFANAYNKNNAKAMAKIQQIVDFTGKKIDSSVQKRDDNYSEDESREYMQNVISSNVSDITQSGSFYKRLISACDDMVIDADDCGSEGVEMTLPITEDTFNYKVRFHWIMELGKFVENYKELPKKGTIHVRTFLSCTHENTRHFCKKCAGLFRRSAETKFIPKNIGIYSTYMITEFATQGALDSMNKGNSMKINAILEKNDKLKFKSFEDAKGWINDIIDSIAVHKVESRFYEIALLSRFQKSGNKYTFDPLISASKKRKDVLGAFIAQSNEGTFSTLLLANEFEANSTRTKIAFDIYDTLDEENEEGFADIT